MMELAAHERNRRCANCPEELGEHDINKGWPFKCQFGPGYYADGGPGGFVTYETVGMGIINVAAVMRLETKYTMTVPAGEYKTPRQSYTLTPGDRLDVEGHKGAHLILEAF